MKRILVACITLCLALAGGFSLHLSQRATAADLTLFRPGKIIDDVIFTDNNSMSVTDIQNFFVQHNSVCLANFTSLSLHDDNGDGVVQDTTTEPYGPGTMTAAQLIKAAADIYRINPKVLLVTLQKEQGLITTNDCAAWKYNTALGYGCPDTSPCDQSAYGFTRQIDYGTYHFRGYFDDSLASVPYGVGNYNIAYNPDSTCGSSSVNIENRATASLYSYTPYQPNQAALDAGYGTGDACSAYGNRNFFSYFTDWFGSTYAPNFSARPLWQQLYTDSTKASALGWNATLVAGQKAYGVVVMKNIGNMTWTNSGAFGATDTRLATYGPWGRQSSFCSNNWVINCTRPAALKEATVAPGESGTFEFPIRAPLQPGSYSEGFAPIVDGRTVFSNGAMTFNINVQAAIFSGQSVWQQIFTDSTKSKSLGWNANLVAGQTAHAVIAVKNTGNVAWTKSSDFAITDTRLATYGPWGRQSSFCSNNWVINCTRPAALSEASVAPGETGTFEFDIKAPSQPGAYTESFSPIVDGRTLFSSGVTTFNFKVDAPVFSAQPVWQQIYTDSSKSTALGWNASLSPNQGAYAVIAMKNTGNMTWTRSGAFTITDTRLATYGPWGHQSSFCSNNWVINCTRPAALSEASVAPGETGTFEFDIKAPSQPGAYTESFSPIVDGRTVFSNSAMTFILNVQ